MKKAFKIVNIVVFFGSIAVLSLFSLVHSVDDYSELENRYLSSFPGFSADNYFSGGYADALADYLDDRFPMRPNFISLHTRLELLQGRKEVNGVWIGDDRMVEPMTEVDEIAVEQSLDAISCFAEAVGKPTYLLLAPTAADIYSSQLTMYKDVVSQKTFIEKCYSKLSKKVTAINVYNTLSAAKDSYIYYRTDHHWTQNGAYIAYTAAAKRMGITPSSLDGFNIMHASHSFYGSLHSKTLNNSIEADTVDFYISNYRTVSKTVADSDGIKGFEGIYLQDNLSKKDKYLSYLGENCASVTLTSNAPSGRLLVIKDSYANCFVPFMAEHYAVVDVIDLRYVMDINDYVKDLNYDAVLFLYNAKNFAEDNNLRKLRALKTFKEQ